MSCEGASGYFVFRVVSEYEMLGAAAPTGERHHDRQPLSKGPGAKFNDDFMHNTSNSVSIYLNILKHCAYQHHAVFHIWGTRHEFESKLSLI